VSANITEDVIFPKLAYFIETYESTEGNKSEHFSDLDV
jgi:hypothetical protein